MTKTYTPKAAEIDHQWFVVDAEGQTLGHLSAAVARVLQGKHKPQYASHMDTGDFVIVVNADKAVLSGRKERQKIYYRQSGRPGGLKAEEAWHLRQRRPIKMIEEAVRGMLPKSTLGRQMARKLKVYAGPSHPHQAQKPANLKLGAAGA